MSETENKSSEPEAPVSQYFMYPQLIYNQIPQTFFYPNIGEVPMMISNMYFQNPYFNWFMWNIWNLELFQIIFKLNYWWINGNFWFNVLELSFLSSTKNILSQISEIPQILLLFFECFVDILCYYLWTIVWYSTILVV
jgi:hypothetical protein